MICRNYISRLWTGRSVVAMCDHCRAFLAAVRRRLDPKPDEVIDKRYGDSGHGYLAPNNKYYPAHCAYCAETDYLMEIYSDQISAEMDAKEINDKK